MISLLGLSLSLSVFPALLPFRPTDPFPRLLFVRARSPDRHRHQRSGRHASTGSRLPPGSSNPSPRRAHPAPNLGPPRLRLQAPPPVWPVTATHAEGRRHPRGGRASARSATPLSGSNALEPEWKGQTLGVAASVLPISLGGNKPRTARNTSSCSPWKRIKPSI